MRWFFYVRNFNSFHNPKQEGTFIKLKPASSQNPDWEQIKFQYLNNSQSVTDLCHANGITKNQLYKFAKKNNWPLRTTKKHALNETTEPNQSALIQPAIPISKIAQPTTTLQQALEYIAMELMHRIQQSTTLSSADHDKDARTLSSLVRTYEKLKDLKSTNEHSSKENEQSRNKGTSAPHEDTDSQRRQLAASLEKLIKGL